MVDKGVVVDVAQIEGHYRPPARWNETGLMLKLNPHVPAAVEALIGTRAFPPYNRNVRYVDVDLSED